MAYLIAQSTMKQRKEYIQELFHCHHGDCENCGVCSLFKGKEPEVVFQDYIEGRKEFDAVMKEWRGF